MDQIVGPVVAGGLGFGGTKAFGVNDHVMARIALVSAATVFLVQQY